MLGFVSVCLMAYVASAPVSAFYFHRLNALAPVANGLCVPLAQFLILPGLAAGMFFWGAPALQKACFFAASYGIGGVDHISRFFSHSFGLVDSFVIPPSAGELFMLLFLFSLVPLCRIFRPARTVAAISAAFLVLAFVVQGLVRSRRTDVILHVVDVGQGLCQVVELPMGRTMVVDGGGFVSSSFDVGEAVVAPYLRRLGVRWIDILVVSHPDSDHLGGAVSLVRQFGVSEVWIGPFGQGASPLFGQFLNEVAKRNIRLRTVTGTIQTALEGGVRIQCSGTTGDRGFRGNDAGLVVRIVHRGKGVLLPGDIGRNRERDLVASGLELESTVIVVPHHGSAGSSSSEFIEAVSPGIAVVSCGHGNPFGHPAPLVIARYERFGTRVFRTDMVGTVSVTIAEDGRVFASGYWSDRARPFSRGSI